MNKDLRYLVVGSGKSGISACRLLDRIKVKSVTLLESNTKIKEDEIREKLGDVSVSDIIIGELADEDYGRFDIAVLSPGVPTDQYFVQRLKESGTKIWGELELGFKNARGKLYAITGTNGKTTTTALTGAIMKEYYGADNVFVVGNIGYPYTDYALDTDDNSVTVAEVSSFMLETIDDFRPEVSAILNITPDHLNRHHNMQNYIRAKFNIAKNQTKDNFIVLNYEDENIRNNIGDINAKIFWFSSKRKLDTGIWLDGEEIKYRESSDDEEIKICTIHDMKLLGVHNYENVMAAAAIALHAGVPVESVRKAVKEFNAVEHRIEFVRELDGVKYYNDSKGTNPDAAIKAVNAMITPTVVIGGGYDKKLEFDEWIESFGTKVRYLVLLGETADQIEACAEKHGFKNIIKVKDLEEAVKVSREKAEKGWSVLLSPACASWDMFPNFEVRGKLFKKYVNEL